MLAFVDQTAWLRRQDFTLSCLGVLHSIATGEVMPDSWYRQIEQPGERLDIATHIQNLNQNKEILEVIDTGDVTSMNMDTDDNPGIDDSMFSAVAASDLRQTKTFSEGSHCIQCCWCQETLHLQFTSLASKFNWSDDL